MKIQASLVVVCALATFALTADAVPKLGVIGDSMSQASHTHDDCSNPYRDPHDCLEERLGHQDHAFSYTAGTQPWSFRTRLGYTAVVDASKDSDRWAEALGQAMTVMADPEVVDVVVALGHNDVCREVDHDYAGDLVEIEGYIDDTLTYLTNQLASRGGSVFIPDLANIVGMRDVMVNQYRYNHWYEYCQGAWDLSDNADDIRDDTAEEYCEEHMGLPSFICDAFGSDDAQELIIDTILFLAQTELEDDRGVCGRVLHSSNTAAERNEAYAFNVALNDLLLRKAEEYDGRNGVDVFMSSGLFDISIKKDYMSKIDCFHVNRTGQQIVGVQTWSTMRLPSCHILGKDCDYLPPPARPTPPLIEVGEIAIDHQWQRIGFQKKFSDPVVVVKPLGGAGGDPAEIRVNAVDQYGFEVSIEEWDYLNGWHVTEKASYLVVERGVHQLENGTWIEASSIETGNTDAFTEVDFTAPFAEAPVLISSLTSINESDAVTVRLRNIGTQSFEIKLQEQEANLDGHANEIIDFVAWEPSTGTVDGRPYEVARTQDTVTDQPFTISYATAFADAPTFLADMQSTDGGDTANLRWANKDFGSVDIWVDEEQSADSETYHTTETVGYILFAIP